VPTAGEDERREGRESLLPSRSSRSSCSRTNHYISLNSSSPNRIYDQL
jgi:hypothetical protein